MEYNIVMAQSSLPQSPHEYNEKYEDISDGRFSIELSDNLIVHFGKALLMKEGTQVDEDWLNYLDREKIVLFPFACFKRILCILNIKGDEASYIEKIRKVENKRISTFLHRRRLAQFEVSKLENKKSQLEFEKERLLQEIGFYQSKVPN